MLAHLSPAPPLSPTSTPDSSASSRPGSSSPFAAARSDPDPASARDHRSGSLRETVCFGQPGTPENLQSQLLQASLASYHGYSRIAEEAADEDLRLFAQGITGVRYGHCRMLAQDILPCGARILPADGGMQDVQDAWSRAVHHLRRGGNVSSPLFCRDITFAENAYEELLTRMFAESHGRPRALLIRLLRSTQEARVCWRELWDVEQATRS